MAVPEAKSLAEQLMGHMHAPDELPAEEAAPTWKPREVRERVTLWDGGVINIKIPADAELVKANELGITYLRFPRAVREGAVNVFVHGIELTRLPGTKIKARPQVKKKVFDDGLVQLYVDLFPVIDGEVNCRLIITHEETVEVRGVDASSTFNVPPPLGGTIIVGYTK